MSGPSRKPALRVPAWLVVPFAAGIGWIVAQSPGLVFGLLAGIALWWSRRRAGPVLGPRVRERPADLIIRGGAGA